MSTDTTAVKELRRAFREWARETRLVFAPYTGSVDEAFTAWCMDNPAQVSAARDHARTRTCRVCGNETRTS